MGSNGIMNTGTESTEPEDLCDDLEMEIFTLLPQLKALGSDVIQGFVKKTAFLEAAAGW